MNCESQFRLFPTFLLSVPLSVAICSYPGRGGYNYSQPGILCSWSGRLEQSPTGHFVPHLHYRLSKKMLKTSFFTFLLHWLTSTLSVICMTFHKLYALYVCYYIYIVLYLIQLLAAILQWSVLYIVLLYNHHHHHRRRRRPHHLFPHNNSVALQINRNNSRTHNDVELLQLPMKNKQNVQVHDTIIYAIQNVLYTMTKNLCP